MNEKVSYKVHYSPNGEEQLKTTCNRYYTSNTAISGTKSKVTCKFCIDILTNKEK